MGPVEAALHAELEGWGAEIVSSALAVSALDVARRLDQGKVSPASASLLHGQLRQYLSDLRELAPQKEETDTVDEIRAQREKRRRGTA
ncbi:hypothetical protein E1264_11710 [Actinomadura sp. KC216]|uniref:hypothetical protein n=1 Tax=Actinomadura sp. KC216 TaxID=2530370 RepID=UPI0010473ADB|nr:hypothetical protein [Actinomadura sp. KC216]TDB88342.1 hypothetical protein E1264_11710 [Actinomadura sp. KC216]